MRLRAREGLVFGLVSKALHVQLAGWHVDVPDLFRQLSQHCYHIYDDMLRLFEARQAVELPRLRNQCLVTR